MFTNRGGLLKALFWLQGFGRHQGGTGAAPGRHRGGTRAGLGTGKGPWRDRDRTVKTQFESIGEHIKYNKILGSRASGQNIHKIDRKTPFGNERVERIKAPAV